MGLRRIVAPEAAPLSLAAAKEVLKVEHDQEDALIESLIEAATELLDGDKGDLGLCLEPQTWEWTRPGFATPYGEPLRLPLAPVISIEAIEYLDPDGALQTLASDAYQLDPDCTPARLYRAPWASWPAVAGSPAAVTIRFRAGHPEGTPAPLLNVMRMLITRWFYYRNDVSVGKSVAELPFGAERLIRKYRVWHPEEQG